MKKTNLPIWVILSALILAMSLALAFAPAAHADDKQPQDEPKECSTPGWARGPLGDCVPPLPDDPDPRPCPEGSVRGPKGDCVVETPDDPKPCPGGYLRGPGGDCFKIEEPPPHNPPEPERPCDEQAKMFLQRGLFEVTGGLTLQDGTYEPFRWSKCSTRASGLAIRQGACEDILNVVKVTNGCSINGHWWVWFGSFTKQPQVDVQVRNTATGEIREYQKTPGQLMTTLKDDEAFRCIQ